MAGGFTEEQRYTIREKLISTGVRLSTTIGFKKMTIAVVAKEAGVAVGSFYNFFDSKESFAVAMITDMEERSMADFSLKLKGRDTVTVEEFLEWYRNSFLPENNFLLRLKLEDWVWLKEHITDRTYFEGNSDMRRINSLLKNISGIRNNFDPAVVVNFIKSIYAIYQNRESFFEDAIQTNIDLIFDAIYRYVKEDEV